MRLLWSPTFRLGELLCLLEELRRRHLLVRGRGATASAATAEQVHAELVHVGQVWTALLNENNDIFYVSDSLLCFSLSLCLSRHQMFHRLRDDAKSAYHSWGTCKRSLALAPTLAFSPYIQLANSSSTAAVSFLEKKTRFCPVFRQSKLVSIRIKVLSKMNDFQIPPWRTTRFQRNLQGR